jgi:1-acyl-sn-glycerol-3-phosphate acyltransferase
VQHLRSLLFTTYMMLSACLYGIFMTLCFWLPYRAHFAIARSWARVLLRLLEGLCGLGYVIEGLENLPAGNHIVMCNHSSAWETIAPFVIFPPQVWVLKRELLWIPFVGWGLKLLNPIAINRGEGHRAVNQVIEQGKERLAGGLWVVIFPEGTRVTAGETRRYGLSGALLATATGKRRRQVLAAARISQKARHHPRDHRQAHHHGRQEAARPERGDSRSHRNGLPPHRGHPPRLRPREPQRPASDQRGQCRGLRHL